jgi:hypothetical protein
VWFITGINSDVSFSVTENNPVMVYPCSAMQWISGEWLYVYAEIYQNDMWLDWKTYIFKENVGILFEPRIYVETENNKVEINNYIKLTYGTLNSGFISLATLSQVDISSYSKLCVEAKTTSLRAGTYEPRFGLTQDYSEGWKSQNWVASQLYEVSEVQKIYKLDISEITGSYYIWLHWGNSNSIIYNFWLE